MDKYCYNCNYYAGVNDTAVCTIKQMIVNCDDLCDKWECLRKDQEAKADAGKPDLTLVPRRIIWDIAEVREYGNKKYHSSDNWKQVKPERYRAAAFRHFLAYLDDPYRVDMESGISHLSHLACNIAFLCEMEHANKPLVTVSECMDEWRTYIEGRKK